MGGGHEAEVDALEEGPHHRATLQQRQSTYFFFILNGWNKERCSYLVSLGTVKKSPVSYRPPQRIIPMFFCSTLRLCLICCGGSERMLRCVLYNQIEPIIYWPPKLLGTCSSTRCRPPLSSSPPGQRGRCRTWKGRMERRTVGQRLSGIDFFFVYSSLLGLWNFMNADKSEQNARQIEKKLA